MSAGGRIILVGGFHEVIELAEACGCEIAGIIEKIPASDFMGYPILGCDADAAALYDRYSEIPLILTPDVPQVRQRLLTQYRQVGWKFASLIHPQARISQSATLGEGVVIQYGAHLSAQVRIGNFVKINTYANVMHDSVVGDFSTIAPNAVILGRIQIGTLCYIGANSTILVEKKIGNGAIVGAAAIVTRDVRAGSTVVGNPARERT